jgi:hypothetical protein
VMSTVPSSSVPLAGIEIVPAGGGGFGGLGISPFGAGPFGGFGACTSSYRLTLLGSFTHH